MFSAFYDIDVYVSHIAIRHPYVCDCITYGCGNFQSNNSEIDGENSKHKQDIRVLYIAKNEKDLSLFIIYVNIYVAHCNVNSILCYISNKVSAEGLGLLSVYFTIFNLLRMQIIKSRRISIGQYFDLLFVLLSSAIIGTFMSFCRLTIQ